jgi:hypothetical protein
MLCASALVTFMCVLCNLRTQRLTINMHPFHTTSIIVIIITISIITFHTFYTTVNDWQATATTTETRSDGGVVVRGEMRCGGQEHFYLECNTTLATPTEEGGLEIWASTQAVTKTQMVSAKVGSITHVASYRFNRACSACPALLVVPCYQTPTHSLFLAYFLLPNTTSH